MAYPTVTDGTLILEAAGVPGLFDKLQSVPGVPVYADHAASADLVWDSAAHNFVVDVQAGSGHAYADIADLDGDGTATGAGFANGGFATSNPLVTADIRLDWTLWPPGAVPVPPPVGGVWWDLANSDPAAMTYVPEPATMVLVALGGLGVLCRRRHR